MTGDRRQLTDDNRPVSAPALVDSRSFVFGHQSSRLLRTATEKDDFDSFK